MNNQGRNAKALNALNRRFRAAQRRNKRLKPSPTPADRPAELMSGAPGDTVAPT